MNFNFIKTIFLSVGLCIAIGSYAQTSTRTSAYYSYKEWAEAVQAGKQDTQEAKDDLIEAKKLIDEVYEYSSDKFVGKQDAKTLYYKGNIYTAFQTYVGNETMAEYNPATLFAEGLQAYKAHINLKDKRSKDDKTDEIRVKMAMMRDKVFGSAGEFFNKALDHNNAGEIEETKATFKKAALSYVAAAELLKIAGAVDTAAYYNAALSASFSEMHEIAATNFRVCADHGFGGASTFAKLAEAYYALDQPEKGHKVIDEAAEKYPKNVDLYITKGNYFLGKKENEKAAKAYEQAIAADPTNETVYYTTGALYYESENYDKAEEMFKKAIELKPDFADALYSLAGVYFNKSVQITKQIDNMASSTIDQDLVKKRDDYLKQAIPYAEKVRTVNPNDTQNLKLLYRIYEQLKMKEKSKEIEDILFN